MCLHFISGIQHKQIKTVTIHYVLLVTVFCCSWFWWRFFLSILSVFFSLFPFHIGLRSHIWVFPFSVCWFVVISSTTFQIKSYCNKTRKNWTCSNTHKEKCVDLLQDQHIFYTNFPFSSNAIFQKLIQYKRKRMSQTYTAIIDSTRR